MPDQKQMELHACLGNSWSVTFNVINRIKAILETFHLLPFGHWEVHNIDLMDTPPHLLGSPKVAEASWINLGISKSGGRIIFISASKKGEVIEITLFLLWLYIVSSSLKKKKEEAAQLEWLAFCFWWWMEHKLLFCPRFCL